MSSVCGRLGFGGGAGFLGSGIRGVLHACMIHTYYMHRYMHNHIESCMHACMQVGRGLGPCGGREQM